MMQNLIRFSSNSGVVNHVIYTINLQQQSSFVKPTMPGAASEQVFYYNARDNFYHTCRQLAKLIPHEKAILVAHDWLELGMASNLGLQYKVMQVLHGNYPYYYELAIKNSKAVDAFVCIAGSIAQKLAQLLPQRQNDIHYLRFPVAGSKCTRNTKQGFNVVFIGRCTKEKGYHLLPGIAVALAAKGIQANWHIVGELMEAENRLYQWPDNTAVHFYGNISNEKVRALLCEMDVVVLPSIAEGMPVSIIEAMKAGVVPIVNDLPGGIQELVLQEQTGIKVPGNDPAGFAEALIKIALNAVERQYMAANTMQRAKEMFDPINNTVAIENLYSELHDCLPGKKPVVKVYGSRLDKPLMPNLITQLIRRSK